MSNMSYCRFRNTLPDFGDCREAVEEMDSKDIEELDREEADALRRLYCEAKAYIQAYEFILGLDNGE